MVHMQRDLKRPVQSKTNVYVLCHGSRISTVNPDTVNVSAIDDRDYAGFFPGRTGGNQGDVWSRPRRVFVQMESIR